MLSDGLESNEPNSATGDILQPLSYITSDFKR